MAARDRHNDLTAIQRFRPSNEVRAASTQQVVPSLDQLILMDLVLSINYQVLVSDFNGAFVSPLSAIRIKDWDCVSGVAINESGVCEGCPPGQTEMRLMSQCLRELGFVQDRNATRDPYLGRSRKWRWSDTSGTSPAAVSVPLQSTAKTVV